jgi:hypothetical protein
MRVRILPAAAALAALSACNGSTNPGLVATATGVFNLSQVDGNALPARGATVITLRGSLNIESSNNQYILSQTDSAIAGGAATPTTYQGNWSLENNAYTFFQGTGNQLLALGTLDGTGDTVRVSLNGHANVYVR